MLTDDQIEEAHTLTIYNRYIIESSESVGCIHCKCIFPAEEVEEFVDKDSTALCPKCNIDSLIGDAGPFDITVAFLKQMYDRFFYFPEIKPCPKCAGMNKEGWCEACRGHGYVPE